MKQVYLSYKNRDVLEKTMLERLVFVRTVCLENQLESSSLDQFTKPKESWITYTQIYGVLQELGHMEAGNTS